MVWYISSLGGSLSVNSFVLVVIVMSTPSSYRFERGLIQSHLFGDDSCCFKRVCACWRYPHSLACVDSLIPANVRMLLRVIRRRSCLCAAMIYAVLITSHTHIMFLDAHKVHGDSHRPFFVGLCRVLSLARERSHKPADQVFGWHLALRRGESRKRNQNAAA